MGLLKGAQGHICDQNPNPLKGLGMLFEVVEQKGRLSQRLTKDFNLCQ